MSGHSKWSNIKHRKGAQDAKRAKIFTRLLRAIQLAVREGGTDPDMNAALAVAIDRAKSYNVPKDTIERALKKDSDGDSVEELVFDAIGPGGTQVIIECATDNKNRTLPEVRSLVEKRGGKIAQNGAARWAFNRTGFVVISYEEEMDTDVVLLQLIEAGAQDVRVEDDVFVAVTAPQDLARVAKIARKQGLDVADATLGWDVVQSVDLAETDQTKLDALVEAVEEHDDVQSVWTNA